MDRRIELDTAPKARRELERCSTALARLDHAFTLARIQLDEAEQQWEDVEADAALAARQGDEKLTATEIKARVTKLVSDDDSASEARQRAREARRNLDLIERWYRSCEKRASAAQSAMKQHESEQTFSGATNFGGR